MSSFEFYGPEKFASCQYHSEEFFAALDDVKNEYPLLSRARIAFEKLHDDSFTFADGEAEALERECSNIAQELKLDANDPPQKYKLLTWILRELDAVFCESRLKKTDIKFRWG